VQTPREQRTVVERDRLAARARAAGGRASTNGH